MFTLLYKSDGVLCFPLLMYVHCEWYVLRTMTNLRTTNLRLQHYVLALQCWDKNKAGPEISSYTSPIHKPKHTQSPLSLLLFPPLSFNTLHTQCSYLQSYSTIHPNLQAAGIKLKELIGSETVTFYVSPFVRSKMTYEQIRLSFHDEQVQDKYRHVYTQITQMRCRTVCTGIALWSNTNHPSTKKLPSSIFYARSLTYLSIIFS